MSQRNDILARISEARALPSHVRLALGALMEGIEDIDMLCHGLMLDPVLSDNILRMARSPYFGSCDEACTAEEALRKIGPCAAVKLLVAAGLLARITDEVQGYDMTPCMMLRYSVTVGVGSEILATILNTKAPDYLFTAGLLSSIGKIVLGSYLRVDGQQILAVAVENQLTFDEAETKVLGINHAEVGSILLERWGLPRRLSSVTRWHICPEDAPDQDVVIDLVHAAHLLAKMAGVGLGLDGLNYEPSQSAIQRLGLTAEHMDKALYEVAEDMADLWLLFGDCAES